MKPNSNIPNNEPKQPNPLMEQMKNIHFNHMAGILKQTDSDATFLKQLEEESQNHLRTFFNNQIK